MILLIPDAAFEDDYALERDLALPATLLVRRAERTDQVPAEEWRQADAVIAYHRLAYDAALAARLARCRILVRAGVGADNVDLAAFGARGIPVCNVPDYGTAEVADHTIGLLLALRRGIVEFHRGVAADPVAGWDWRRWPAPVRRLAGQRLLLVGFGAVGRAVAARAATLGLEIGYCDPAAGAAPGVYLKHADLDAALGWADMVSLHAALTPATRGLIGRARIAAMKPGALLINTARGALVDLDALTEGLRSGRLGGAALDVLPGEPPDPAHPLFRALSEDASWLKGRFVVTPHSAFLSADAIAEMRTKSVVAALDFLRHGRLGHCMNRQWLPARDDD